MMSKRALCQLARVLEGLPILGCLEGRPADRAGIRYGDVLLSVNGRRTRSFVDYVEARDLRTDGMQLVVFRHGAECAIELTFTAADAPPARPAVVAELREKRLDASMPGGDEPILS